MVKFTLSKMRLLYDSCIGWADHPYGVQALCCMALIESIFFPIPVDPLLMAMSTGRPKKSLYFSLLTTIFSVLGAFGGYMIGAIFWNIMSRYIATEGGVFLSYFHVAQNMFKDHALWAMVLAGFTFLPFKVFTVSAGLCGVGLVPFFIGSLLGRAARFFLIGALFYFFGSQIRGFIEAHFEKTILLICALVVLTAILCIAY